LEVTLDNAREGPNPPLSSDRGLGEQLRTGPDGSVSYAYAVHDGGAAATDQWPMVALGKSGLYLGANGDGIGFYDGPGVQAAERKSLLFSWVEFYAQDGNIRCKKPIQPFDPDVAGYNPSPPDNYKPHALFYDQKNRDLHCFLARGIGATAENRRRAWLITSGAGATSWNVAGLPSLGTNPVFDAVAGSLVPVGVCNRHEGSVAPDGYLYFYLNRQGNASDNTGLYPAGDPYPERKPVYCARIKAPRGLASRSRRHAWFKNQRNYEVRTATGWTRGQFQAAAAIHTPDVYMGKHFLVWWVPSLGQYVAAKTHSRHAIWLAVANNPWGPFTPVFDRPVGATGLNDGKFTAALLPSPVLREGLDLIFPLVFSGAPGYDGLHVAKIRFKLG
jgi:hypothetical protein